MNLKIVIAQFYTSNVSYGKYSEEINKKYCDENNFTYKPLVFSLSILPNPLIDGFVYNKIDSEYFFRRIYEIHISL